MPTVDKEEKKDIPKVPIQGPILIEPYDSSNEPKKLIEPKKLKMNVIPNPIRNVKIKDPCEYEHSFERLKVFRKKVPGKVDQLVIKEYGGELLVLFSNGTWLSPWYRRVTDLGKFYHHLLFLDIKGFLVETDLDIIQEYVPHVISINTIIKNWIPNIAEHTKYLPQRAKSMSPQLKTHKPTPYKIEDFVLTLYRRHMLSSPKNMSEEALIKFCLSNYMLNATSSKIFPFKSINEDFPGEFIKICLH